MDSKQWNGADDRDWPSVHDDQRLRPGRRWPDKPKPAQAVASRLEDCENEQEPDHATA